MNNLLLRRRMLMQAGGSPTPTLPYVQNGLIGWWDGIWNAGIGQHDSNATTWVDLSGNNRDATLANATYSWGADHWDIASGYAQWNGLNLGTDQTIEFLVQPSSSSSQYGRYIAEAQSVPSPCYLGGILYIYGYGIDRQLNYYGDLSSAKHLHCVTHQGIAGAYYLDNTNYATFAGSNPSSGATYAYFANRPSLGRQVVGKYFCVRWYNRVLTADELLSNYLTDRQRFNF